jgi:hypothetical protein
MNIQPNLQRPNPRPNPYVSADLAQEVKKELGDEVLSGFGDPKVDTLQRYFFQGEEFVGFDPAKHLGDNWKAMDEDQNFLTKEFRLRADLNGDWQDLVLDTRDDSMRISTGNVEPGPFEGTIDIEHMWFSADGVIKRNRATAV